MPHVVDTNRLVAENWLNDAQASEIARRSRETMIDLAVNVLLCAGIAAATFGLIFWLQNAFAVALAGAVFFGFGALVLLKGGALYRMLGNAGALVGAGMLIGGAGFELIDKYASIAEPVMIVAGLAVAGASLWAFLSASPVFRFAAGAVMLFGLALHGSGMLLAFQDVHGGPRALFLAYITAMIFGAGTVLNVRFVTAFAIIPFAQMLDTSTDYFHAMYSFYSPESTLTILQMAALVGACVWASTRLSERVGRHLGIMAIMAVIVGNLAFLVGSLWGDLIGISFAEGRPPWNDALSHSEWRAQIDAWEAQFFYISEHVYSIVWAILLAAGAFWAAHANRRGLFNAAMTFAGIHAYTQLFETMGDEPLAWALGGLAAIPLAWGLWRFNQYLSSRQASA